MELFDNVTHLVKDDLQKTIGKGSRLSMAAACFSIYAFDALKKELSKIDSLRFLFTSPTFLKERAAKEKREFYIPRLAREKSLYGTEFELKLRNKMTQRAIARECADWIREKVQFRSFTEEDAGAGYLIVENSEEADTGVYLPMNGFTTSELGCERSASRNSLINRLDAPAARAYLQLFDGIWNNHAKPVQDVTDILIEHISHAYNENAPEFLYFVVLYNLFKDYLEHVSEDDLPNEAVGFRSSKIWNLLFDFQKDAALGIIQKLEQYNGCILADSVGLGKTYTALAVIKYYQQRNKSILVLCPKKLAENWNTYRDNYKNNPVADDRLNYTVLFHTDLSRERGTSNGVDLARLNWQNYDLVVIDESHNFRNGEASAHGDKENRYMKLMRKVMRGGVRTKVLMLSATPVNNKFSDLKNQLALAYEGDAAELDEKLETNSSIQQIFRQAQQAYNEWCDLPLAERKTERLLRSLSFDFFKLLDSVTIARSRRHIQKYYDMDAIGRFPRRLRPLSLRPRFTKKDDAITYQEIADELGALTLAVYTPSHFLLASRRAKYEALAEMQGKNISVEGREEGIRKLMGVNLMKRLESSVHSFRMTLDRVKVAVDDALGQIAWFEENAQSDFDIDGLPQMDSEDLDIDDAEYDGLVGRNFRFSLRDMDVLSWKEALQKDQETLALLLSMVKDIGPEDDEKLQTLKRLLVDKMERPINPGNRKCLIFTAFADTAAYLYEELAPFVKHMCGIDTALITGTGGGKTTREDVSSDFNEILTCFSPISKDRAALGLPDGTDIDLLIATDCISEGQNLQDCDYLVNYDIHWNPVRIIQRFGRIDRIGSHNKVIQLVNFWPDVDLDEYIHLKARVETRMKLTVMTSTGDDDPINLDEHGDLAYRREQLKRLQEEVVDIEDMNEGISIMDLGLNEYRLAVMDYLKHHEELRDVPPGLHAVVPATDELPPGIVFVLRNINDSVNIDRQNQLHPYYMVYIGTDGTVVCDYLQPKQLLDDLHTLCYGKKAPVRTLCEAFNRETDDGADMRGPSELLSEAINSILDTKEESDIDSLFRAGGTTALLSEVQGIDDFELIAFVVVEEAEA